MAKFYTCRSNTAFKTIICNTNKKIYLKAILETVLNKEVDEIIICNPELLKYNVNTKNKTVDLLIKSQNERINVELNSYNSNKQRNFAYIANEYITNTKVGEEYNPNIQYIQINLTYGLHDDKDYRKYYMQDEFQSKYIDNFYIIEYDMDRLNEYYINNNKNEIEKYKYLIMLNLEPKDLIILGNGDEVVMNYKEDITELNNNNEYIPFLSAEEDDRKLVNTWIHEAKDEGIKEGIEKGQKQTTINIINNLNNLGISYDKIAKSVNLSIDEVKEIIKGKN